MEKRRHSILRCPVVAESGNRSVSDVTTQLSEIEAQIAQLQAQAADIRARTRADALSQALALVKQYGLSAQELGLTAIGTRSVTRRKTTSADAQPTSKRTAILRLIAQTLVQQGPQRSRDLAAAVQAAALPVPSGHTANVEVTAILSGKKALFARLDDGRWQLTPGALEEPYLKRALA